MVETLLQPRTGASQTAEFYASQPRQATSESASAPRPQAYATPFAQVSISPLTQSTVTPDVLIRAQQFQDAPQSSALKARVFEARKAYDLAQSASSPSGHDIKGHATPRPAPVVELFPERSAFAAVLNSVPPQPTKAAFPAANRAYIGAGAQDGRTFGADHARAARLSPSANSLDLVI